MTLDEVAAALGISRTRVWQIEQKALRKMRKAIRRMEAGKKQTCKAADVGASAAEPSTGKGNVR